MGRKNTTYSSHPNRASRAAHKEAKLRYPTYDTSLIVPPKKTKKYWIIGIVSAIVIVAIVCFVLLTCTSCGSGGKTLEAGKTAEVTINEGSSADEIAELMSKNGVVEDVKDFKSAVSEMNASTNLKPGTYVFEGGKSVKEYVQILCDGPESSSPKLVVSEGMRLRDIAKAVEKHTKSRITSDEFMQKCSNASTFASKYSFLNNAGTKSLEGFLFPKTYTISSNDSVDDIICLMLDQFDKEIKELDFSYPNSKNLDIYDVVTLSSIVVKESNGEVDSRVASVFYNRLSSGMYLNSDATTAYEVGHDPTSDEVHSNTPYSTYTNFGLPPTPICSPGLSSLKAVCNPEKTDYLYFFFVQDKSGKTQYKFSKTFEEHQQAIVDMRDL